MLATDFPVEEVIELVLNKKRKKYFTTRHHTKSHSKSNKPLTKSDKIIIGVCIGLIALGSIIGWCLKYFGFCCSCSKKDYKEEEEVEENPGDQTPSSPQPTTYDQQQTNQQPATYDQQQAYQQQPNYQQQPPVYQQQPIYPQPAYQHPPAYQYQYGPGSPANV